MAIGVAAAVVIAFVSSLLVGSVAYGAAAEGGFVAGEVILLFDDDALAARTFEAARDCAADGSHEVAILDVHDPESPDSDASDPDDPVSLVRACDPLGVEDLGDGVRDVSALSLTVDERCVDHLVRRFGAIEGVHAQPNFVYEIADQDVSALATRPVNDARLSEQYYLGPLGTGRNYSGANVFAAWNLVRSARRSPVTVAALDMGVDLAHEDLRGAVRTDLAYDVLQRRVGSSDPTDHGTGVLGVIGAAANNGRGIAGVASGVDGTRYLQLIPVDVYGSDGTTTTSRIVMGLAYLDRLLETGQVDDLRVVNMSMQYRPSFGYGDDVAVHSLITHMANDHDVLFVCAGGNSDDRALTAPVYPSDYDECLSVTALTRSGGNSVWSDYNQAKDVSAPGERILTTCLGGYATRSGTSYAAPIASGVAALMFSVYPDLGHEQAIGLIRGTARPLPNPTLNDHRGATGSAGALDAAGAVAAAMQFSPGGSPVNGAGSSASGDVFRLLNPYTGEHHYTLDAHECDSLVQAGWLYEGVAWTAPEDGVPVYRIYNPSSADHHYTTSLTERATLLARGWRDEGIAWASADGGDDAVPVYRLFNRYAKGAGTHHYTTSPAEYVTLPSKGWQQEGICWYGLN